MKKAIAKIIVKAAWEGVLQENDRYYALWDGDTLYWTEKTEENTFKWDGSEGVLCYHGNGFQIENYRFTTPPFIMDDSNTIVFSDGHTDLEIKLN